MCWEHQTSCSEQNGESRVPSRKRQGWELLCTTQTTRSCMQHSLLLPTLRQALQGEGRAQKSRSPNPARGEFPRRKSQQPALCRAAPALHNPCAAPSAPRALPAALLSGGLRIIKPKPSSLPDQEKLNETKTSLPWGRLMLALTVLLH